MFVGDGLLRLAKECRLSVKQKILRSSSEW